LGWLDGFEGLLLQRQNGLDIWRHIWLVIGRSVLVLGGQEVGATSLAWQRYRPRGGDLRMVWGYIPRLERVWRGEVMLGTVNDGMRIGGHVFG